MKMAKLLNKMFGWAAAGRIAYWRWTDNATHRVGSYEQQHPKEDIQGLAVKLDWPEPVSKCSLVSKCNLSDKCSQSSMCGQAREVNL